MKVLSFVLPGPCGCEVINNDGGLCRACSCPHQTATDAAVTPRRLTVFSGSLGKTMNAAFPQWGLKTVDFSGLCGSEHSFKVLDWNIKTTNIITAADWCCPLSVLNDRFWANFISKWHQYQSAGLDRQKNTIQLIVLVRLIPDVNTLHNSSIEWEQA